MITWVVCRNNMPLVMTDWRLPTDWPPEAHQYAIPESRSLVTWVESLHNTSFSVQRWSWWQLYIDAFLEVPGCGPWYHVNSKKWKGGQTQPPEAFLRRSRWFSKFFSKLARACKVSLPLEHTSVAGSKISFWTSSLPVQVPLARTQRIDDWLGQYITNACKTADLRKVCG